MRHALTVRPLLVAGALLAATKPVAHRLPPFAVYGDVNADAVVNIIDAQQVARFSVALSIANPAAMAANGDVTADGFVSIIDAQQIARFSVGLSAAARINTTVGTGGNPQITATANFTFVPNSLDINAGTSVDFVFQAVQHSVQFTSPNSPADIGSFASPVANQTVTRTFNAAGTFNFFCTIHGPTMNGAVIVH